MAKTLIIAISCLIALSLVFGMTFNDSINFFANKIAKTTDTALTVVDFITGEDFKINAFDRYAIDYKYCDLGSIDNFEYGHIDKAKYFINHHMPEFFNRDIAGFNVKAKIDPYYYNVDFFQYTVVDGKEYRTPLVQRLRCIRYTCEITVGSLVDAIIEPSKPNSSFKYEVFVLASDLSDSGLVISGRYLVTNNTLIDSLGHKKVFISNQYNNLFQFCLSSDDNKRLNGNYSLEEKANEYYCITNINKGILINDGDYANIFFYGFLVD